MTWFVVFYALPICTATSRLEEEEEEGGEGDRRRRWWRKRRTMTARSRKLISLKQFAA